MPQEVSIFLLEGDVLIYALKEIIRDPGFAEGAAWWQRDFSAHETIVWEGEEGRSLYMVESGELRVTGRVELEGRRQVQPGFFDLKEGDLFGELSLFGDHPRIASVTAITEGRLLEMDSGQLSKYLDNHPELGYYFMKELFSTQVERLDRANQRVESIFAWGLKAHGIDKHL